MIHSHLREFWSASTRTEAAGSLYEARRDIERYFEKHSRKAFALGFLAGVTTVVLFPFVVGLSFLAVLVGGVRYLMKSGAQVVGQGH